MNKCSVLWLFVAAVSGCGALPSASNDAALSTSDECNGFVLRLTVTPRSPQAGDVIRATAALENTTDTDMTVHYLNIAPQYLDAGTEECQPVVLLPKETLDGWRIAYHTPGIFMEEKFEVGIAGGFLGGSFFPIWLDPDISPFVLNEWAVLSTNIAGGFLGGPFFPIWLAPDTSEIKQGCELLLNRALFGDFYPTYVIPAHSTITMSASFKATPERNWIDTGLFSLENFYTKDVLEKSREQSPDPGHRHYGTMKFTPRIWFGSLYAGVEVVVPAQRCPANGKPGESAGDGE